MRRFNGHRAGQIVLVVLASLTGPTTHADAPEIVSLANGMRIVFIPFEGSKDVEIISTVPLGLCSDEKNRAQWSHLLEHLVVTRDGIQPFDEINAETMSDCMHLDYTRPAGTWREGIELHARWLSNSDFAEDTVQREIGRVVEEVNGLATNGRTMKFATGAWAQAVRYAARHVEMNGDVKRATADELASYFKSRFLDGPPPVLVIAGRFDRADIEQSAREVLEPIRIPAIRNESETWAAPAEVPATVTWDLPTSHLIFAWRIPDDATLTELAHLHAAAPALSQLVSIPAAEYLRPGTYVLPEVDVRVADRRYVLLGMTLQEHDSAIIARAKQDVRKAAQTLVTARGPSRAMGRLTTVQQWQQALDPASALELVSAPNLPRRLVEGNLAVAAALRQFEFDRSLPAMITALEQGSDEAGRAALIRVFNEESVTSLVITPQVDAPPAGE